MKKSIAVNVFEEVQRKTREKESTEAFKDALRERQTKVEGVFAEAKTFHGLSRARYRGRAKMQIQAYMVATVQNLKRLISFIPDMRPLLGNLGNFLGEIFFFEKRTEVFFIPAQ